jgi:DNA-binding Lrp family transcriptional regulator
MSGGYIKLPRDFTEAVQLLGADAMHLWVDLWMRAAWRARVAQLTEYGAVQIARGQVIFSANRASKRLGISRGKVRRYIERWESVGWIRREPLTVQCAAKGAANPPSLVTIVQYDVSDAETEASGQSLGQGANKARATRDPERTTNTESRRRKSTREQTGVPPDFGVSDPMRLWAAEHVPHISVDAELPRFIDWHLSKGTRHVDWSAAFRNWLRKATQYIRRPEHQEMNHAGRREHRQLRAVSSGEFADFDNAPRLPRSAGGVNE